MFDPEKNFDDFMIMLGFKGYVSLPAFIHYRKFYRDKFEV